MYCSKDVSIIIVSYNRPNELERNFIHLEKLKSKPYEVIVVDQSEKPDTKKVCQKFSKKISNLRYLRSEKPSIAIAKNVGVKNASENTKILLFLDDDAYVGPSYLDEIIAGYNRHPEAAGIFGEEKINTLDCELPINNKSFLIKIKFSIEQTYKKIFLLGYRGDRGWMIRSPFGNTFSYRITGDVPAQWFSGTDPSFKKHVFKDLKFDENFFGWSLGEDIDISYRIHKKYGALYVIPSSLVHENPKREDTMERRIKRIYMNQINHFYLFYKDMSFMQLRFIWNYIGIFLARFISLFNPFKSKENYIEFKYLFLSFFYCLFNLKKIKKGDLSLPEIR